jgi:UDP-2-acetamido-2,6-beta-L-arabino-hexul-4-ose reductase
MGTNLKKVLITGANGFIGKNLKLYLAERKDVQLVSFTRDHSIAQLPELLRDVNFIFHLAGINRPQDPKEFAIGNTHLTQALCNAVAAVAVATGKKIPVLCSSSIQANYDNIYGQSKRAAEEALFALQRAQSVPVYVFRLPNVFGKWCKPNYNSVVATFCHNTAHGLPIQITDPSSQLTLVYVDDVIERFIQLMDGADCHLDADGFESVTPQYTAKVGYLAEQIMAFNKSRTTLVAERVGSGLVRALYSTYISYLPPERFSYDLPLYGDERGVFVEMLKTPDCGQFSFFTVLPSVTRGSHYHHTKTEKFLVLKGAARMRFRHMVTGETCEIALSGNKPQVVDTIPGWAHDITNIGDSEAVVMLWANEAFDRKHPDCIPCQV